MGATYFLTEKMGDSRDERIKYATKSVQMHTS